MPTSAAASAGASLMPSPTMATPRHAPARRPCSWPMMAALSSGSTSARTMSMPSCRATRFGAAAVVAGHQRGAVCPARAAGRWQAAALALSGSPNASRPSSRGAVARHRRARTRSGPRPRSSLRARSARPSGRGRAPSSCIKRGAAQPRARGPPPRRPCRARRRRAAASRGHLERLLSRAAQSRPRASGCSLPDCMRGRPGQQFMRLVCRGAPAPPARACLRSACRSCRRPPP